MIDFLYNFFDGEFSHNSIVTALCILIVFFVFLIIYRILFIRLTDDRKKYLALGAILFAHSKQSLNKVGMSLSFQLFGKGTFAEMWGITNKKEAI